MPGLACGGALSPFFLEVVQVGRVVTDTEIGT